MKRKELKPLELFGNVKLPHQILAELYHFEECIKNIWMDKQVKELKAQKK